MSTTAQVVSGLTPGFCSFLLQLSELLQRAFQFAETSRSLALLQVGVTGSARTNAIAAQLHQLATAICMTAL